MLVIFFGELKRPPEEKSPWDFFCFVFLLHEINRIEKKKRGELCFFYYVT